MLAVGLASDAAANWHGRDWMPLWGVVVAGQEEIEVGASGELKKQQARKRGLLRGREEDDDDGGWRVVAA